MDATKVDDLQPKRDPSTARGPVGVLGPASLRMLQRTVGNQAVARLLSPAAPTPVQRNGEHEPPPLSGAAKERAERIRASASSRLLKVAAYNETADGAIQVYRDKRLAFADRWGRAWTQHNSILQAAGEEAASENMIEGIVVGVVAGLVVAAAATVLFPAAAGAAAFTGGWWAFNVGTGVASGVAGTAGGAAIGRPSVEGPTSGQRDAEADAWKAIVQVEKTARNVAKTAPKFGLELGNAEYAIAQVQAHIDGGTTDMNWDQTLQMVSTLASWETGLAGFDSAIDGKLEAMASFRTAAEQFEIPPVNQLEKEIWYVWMTKIRDDEVLDQDEIQKHLVRLGIIPDYTYFSDEDQHRAVRDARTHVEESSASGSPPAPFR